MLAYIFAGGFVAVAWSDLFQGLIMLVGLVMLPIVAWMMLDTDTGVGEGLRQLDPNLMEVWGNSDGFSLMNIMAVLGLMLIGIALGACGGFYSMVKRVPGGFGETPTDPTDKHSS